MQDELIAMLLASLMAVSAMICQPTAASVQGNYQIVAALMR